MATVLGLRGTGDFSAAERPENYREGLLRLYPNGSVTLTALTGMLPSQSTDDAIFHWFSRTLSRRGGALTGLYTDVNMSAAYSFSGSPGIAGTVLYAKVTDTIAEDFRAGHVVVLRKSGDILADVAAKVTAVYKSFTGVYTRLTLVLLEADDNSANYNLESADIISLSGNANPEGHAPPTAISRTGTEIQNNCQIFDTKIEVTDSVAHTKSRIGNALDLARDDAIEDHGIEMENAFLFGVRASRTGDNGQPERYTMGLVSAIKTYASGNCFQFAFDTNTAYVGLGFVTVGEQWMVEKLMTIFKYGSKSKFAFCGNGAMMLIDRMVKNVAAYQLMAKTIEYGIQIREYMTPFGTIMLHSHPLFNNEESLSYTIVIFEPKNLKYRFLQGQDTHKQVWAKTKAAIEESYITEAGMEFHKMETCGLLELAPLNLQS